MAKTLDLIRGYMLSHRGRAKKTAALQPAE